jgi:hypothetical protein
MHIRNIRLVNALIALTTGLIRLVVELMQFIDLTTNYRSNSIDTPIRN